MKKTTQNKVADLIKNGTPKQKAVLLCMDWTDKNTVGAKPLLTEEEADALRNSFKTAKARSEFWEWVRIYNTYADIVPSFGLIYAEFKANANALLVSIRQWEDYTQQEVQLNSILEELKERNDATGIEAFDEAVRNMCTPFAEIRRDSDGYIEIYIGAPGDDGPKLYNTILRSRETCAKMLGLLKAYVQALEEWTKEKDSAALMPPIMENAIKEAKSDYALHVAPAYSEHQLNKRIARGEHVQEYAKMKAVFPDYDKIEVRKQDYEKLKRRIERSYESEK